MGGLVETVNTLTRWVRVILPPFLKHVFRCKVTEAVKIIYERMMV